MRFDRKRTAPEVITPVERVFDALHQRHKGTLVSQKVLEGLAAELNGERYRKGTVSALLADASHWHMDRLPEGTCLTRVTTRLGGIEEKRCISIFHDFEGRPRRIKNSLFLIVHKPGAKAEEIARQLVEHPEWVMGVGTNQWVQGGHTFLLVETFQKDGNKITRKERRFPLLPEE